MHDSILSFVWILILAFGACLTILLARSAVSSTLIAREETKTEEGKWVDTRPTVIIRIAISPLYIVISAIATSAVGWLFFILAGEFTQVVQIGGLFWMIVVFVISAIFHGVFCFLLIFFSLAEMIKTEDRIAEKYSENYRVKSEIAMMMQSLFLS